jgi:hypothetical protein
MLGTDVMKEAQVVGNDAETQCIQSLDNRLVINTKYNMATGLYHIYDFNMLKNGGG